MRRVILYLTTSLDGFIADAEGGVGWLAGDPECDYGYAEFYASVDAVLFGRTTYEQIVGWGGDFPYADKPVFVFTSDPDIRLAADTVTPVTEPAERFVARMKLSEGGDIWLGGGGALARSLMDARLVDEIRLFVQPVLLGDGIPLFAPDHRRVGLALEESRTWPAGLVELRYSVPKQWRDDLGLS